MARWCHHLLGGYPKKLKRSTQGKFGPGTSRSFAPDPKTYTLVIVVAGRRSIAVCRDMIEASAICVHHSSSVCICVYAFFGSSMGGAFVGPRITGEASRKVEHRYTQMKNDERRSLHLVPNVTGNVAVFNIYGYLL